jgi:hypothetical protein
MQVIYERQGWVTVMCKGADVNVFAIVSAAADAQPHCEPLPADAPGQVRSSVIKDSRSGFQTFVDNFLWSIDNRTRHSVF